MGIWEVERGYGGVRRKCGGVNSKSMFLWGLNEMDGGLE